MPGELCSAVPEPGRPEPPVPPAGRVPEWASEGLLAVEARNGPPGALPDPDGDGCAALAADPDRDAGAALVLEGAGLGADRTVGRIVVVLTGGGSGELTGSFGAALTVGAGSTLTWGAGEVSTVTGAGGGCGSGGGSGRTFSGGEGMGGMGSGGVPGSSWASPAVGEMRPPTSIAATSVTRAARRARLDGVASAIPNIRP
jgi:hypothetical protein